MKCEKCGAEIQNNRVYCSVCGKEVQLVPDYNLLDDDILSVIIQNETNKKEQKKGSSKTKKKKISSHDVIFGCICFTAILAVAFLVYLYQDTRIRRKNSYSYQFQQGEAFYSKGDFCNARLYMERAIELNPESREVKMRLLDIYLEEKDEEAAVYLLKELISVNKNDRELIQQLIAIYDKREDYEAILALCEELHSSDMLDLFEDYLVKRPKFSSISGIYGKPLEISISAGEDDLIYYTVNGQDPVEYGQLYQDAVSLREEGTVVLSAVAKNEKGIYSEMAKASYTIQFEAPKMPSVAPAGGTYTESQLITVDVPPDCTAYYTWDGSDPTEYSSKYTGPLEMMPGNQVLSVILINSIGLKSSVYKVNYIYMP